MKCTGTPISWLRLERYHTGDLPERERAEIATHLRECAECTECLSRIRSDDEERELPPLPLPLHFSRALVTTTKRSWYARSGRIAAMASAIAIAAAIALVVGKRPKIDDLGSRTKGGGEVAFSLVHETEGIVPEGGGIYHEGDRFKALVTCPPGMVASWDLVVYDDGEASFPLAPEDALACENQFTLHGAFRVNGRGRITVCLLWNEDGRVDRKLVRSGSTMALSRSVCIALGPAQ